MQWDKDLELLRLCQNLRRNCEFIFVDSIIRGAVLVDSGEASGGLQDFFLFDILDPDMFLRGWRILEGFVLLISCTAVVVTYRHLDYRLSFTQ
jgi:hypothetical protein